MFGGGLMKWKNKGHEFDGVYDNISKRNKYYLYGAGDYGSLFYSMVKNDLNILGFIDSNKKEKTMCGLHVYSLEDIKLTEDVAIIVTASQFARIGIISKLKELGYKQNDEYYIIEVFLSVYYAYNHGRVYFTNISMLPSTLCNLNCECCLNFNQFAKKPDIRPIEKVKEDIDLFFSAVDKVMLYHFSGGETFLYKDAVEVIKYLCVNYRHRIGDLRMITNGTIVPKDEVLQALSVYDFELYIDDYREAVPQFSDKFDMLISKLQEFKIRYRINKDSAWIDLAPTKTDNSHFSESELIRHFDTCSQSWQELRDGKLYSCNYDGYATVAGINAPQVEEIYDLRTYTKDKVKEIVEFRLGYNNKGYTNLCTHCRGFREENHVTMMPAKQI